MFIIIHLFILVFRCEPLRITSELLFCALPLSIALILCASREKYVSWATIGSSSPPHLCFNYVGFLSSSSHSSSAHSWRFAVARHLLVYSIVLSFYFWNPSALPDIPTKSFANINPDNIFSSTSTRCLAASIAIVSSLPDALNKVWVAPYKT